MLLAELYFLLYYICFGFYRDNHRKMICPSDGLDYQNEILIKDKKTKNSNSKMFDYIFNCLECGEHIHMLQYLGSEKKQFKVRLINKKSPKWNENDISLFIAMDLLSKTNYRLNEGKNYEEKCKVRFKSRMSKLKKYVREEELQEINKVEKWRIYTILKRPVTGKKNKKNLKISEKKAVNMDSGTNKLSSIGVNEFESGMQFTPVTCMGIDEEVDGVSFENFICNDKNVMLSDSGTNKLSSIGVNEFESGMWFGPSTCSYFDSIVHENYEVKLDDIPDDISQNSLDNHFDSNGHENCEVKLDAISDIPESNLDSNSNSGDDWTDLFQAIDSDSLKFLD